MHLLLDPSLVPFSWINCFFLNEPSLEERKGGREEGGKREREGRTVLIF
jgi:hypothetical protein